MTYNLHIMAFREYYLFAISEEDLAKAIEAHDIGAKTFSIPGERVVHLEGFRQMRIYANELKCTRDQVVQFMESDAAHLGQRYWQAGLLTQLGREVTREKMHYGFGERPRPGVPTSALASTSGLGLWDLLHPNLAEVSRKLYEDGSFKEAAQAALTEVDALVRKKYREVHSDGKTGAQMMAKAFAKNNPVFQLFPLDDQDQEIKQEGYMHIFMGAMMALRNPKSHSNFKIEEQDAIELLFLASRLLRKLDEAVP